MEEATGGAGSPNQFEQNPRLAPVQTDHGVTSGMTNNYLYLILALKSPPKEDHKPHLHNTMHVQAPLLKVHVRPDARLDTYDDKASLSKYSP